MQIEMLSMDDPDFVAKFKAAIGLQKSDCVQFAGPQFDRADGVTPCLVGESTFALLKDIAPEHRRSLGMQQWDEADPNGQCLWLFPAEWFGLIPAGFEVEDINGDKEFFDPLTSDRDRRFGALSYGVRAKA